MKLRVGWVMLCALCVSSAAHSADLQFVERFALAEDRAEVLKELVPGTEDFYYFNCLYLQEKGSLDEVKPLLEAWVGRYGETEQVREIRNRQALLRYPSKPEETLAYLKSIFGLSFEHQRQVPGEAPGLPTTLDPALISREHFLDLAFKNSGYPDSVDALTPHAFPWLLATELSPNRLRNLLSKLTLPDYSRLPELIAKDLDEPNSSGFGSLDIHRLLVREQLDALLQLKPDLLDNDAFIEAYLRRLQPGNDDLNWQRDPAAMTAYLDRLWTFVQRLSPAQTSLKAHVLYHRLAFDISQGGWNRDRFLQYLKLPRYLDYVNPEYLKKTQNTEYMVDFNQNYNGATGLPGIGSDEALIGDYLRHFFESEKGYDAFKPYLREAYLRPIFAETKLLQGQGNLEQWYAWLDPAQVDALKNRVDLAFVPENKQRFALDEAVTLNVWVKNVDRLLVKVFEIDTRNYYQHFNQEINTAIDLDGLVANHEQVYTYTEAPLTRVRREFTFPELTGRGVWVIEFVGNGTSSRAVVAKGALQYLSRSGPAGQVFTVFDETGKKVPDASIWFFNGTYSANTEGEITLPFSTEPGTHSMLLCSGDFTSLASFDHLGEDYRLATGFHVDPESLRSGLDAKVAVRPLLYLNGAPAPLSLLKHPVLDIRSRTWDGIESSQQVADIALQNNELSIQTLRVPENLAALSFSLSGTADRLTGGDPIPLRAEGHVTVNGIHGTQQTAAFFLARSSAGAALELRDQNGQPLADRAVSLSLAHRDFISPVTVELQSDAQGRIALGALPDITSLSAVSATMTSQTWTLAEAAFTYPPALQASTRNPLHVPLPGNPPKNVADAASLLELRKGVYVADHSDVLTLEDGYLVVTGLEAGDYLLHLKDADQQIALRVTDGEDSGTTIASTTRVLESPAPAVLQIQSVSSDSAGLKILVGGANDYTRVHVVATRFLPDRYAYPQLNVIAPAGGSVRTLNQGYALYTSGRQIGDEYRYVLERRFAAKFPGNMLERPSLLLNPWSLEETHAEQEAAQAGEPAPSQSAPASPAAEAVGINRPEEQRQAFDFSPNFDFLDGAASTLYNLKPDKDGVVTIPAADLQGRGYLQIVATDPFATVSAYTALDEQSWTPGDRRLITGLDPATHLVEQKRVQVLEAGADLKVSLTGDADVQLYDSVPSVLGLFMALNGDAKLKEFSFVSRWPSLTDAEKREKFSAFESHELNLFLYHKDRAFFDAVVKPFLANKFQKTFIDRWLLEEDLKSYLDPWQLGQLNLVEKILLAKRLPEALVIVGPHVRDAFDMLPPNPERFNTLFMTALYGGSLSGDAGHKSRRAGFEVHDMVLSHNTSSLFAKSDGITDVGGNPVIVDSNYSNAFGTTRARGLGGGGGFGGGGGGIGGDPNGPPGNGGFDPRLGLDVAGEVNGDGIAMFDSATPPAPAPKEEAKMKRRADKSDGVRANAEKPALQTVADSKGIKQYVFFSANGAADYFARDEASSESNRYNYRALYRAVEKTKALVENDYYKLPAAQAGPGLIPVNAFWRDYLEVESGKAFLSSHLAEATSSVTEAMLALAVLDLPFTSPKHEITSGTGEYTLKAGGAAIAFYKDIEPAAESGGDAPLLVSQNYFRSDDRFRFEGNQQFDKFVTDEFLTGVVYGCQVTVTNPGSAPYPIEVLHQIPSGAMPVNSGRYTRSERMGLGPYSTTRLEYFFYFPKAGAFTHFPVHVSQDGKLLASAVARPLSVVDVPTTADTTSWQYISQQGTPEAVMDFLKKSNLNRLDLNLLLWRMKDKAFYQQVIDLLKSRAFFAPELWSYAVLHNDTEGLKTLLQYRDDFVAQSGPCIESALLNIEPVERKTYQHMEFAPLLNPRAHHPEGKWMITNDKLEQQYTSLVRVLAHRTAPRQEDLLALTYYLLLQDRVEEALIYFGQVKVDQLPARIQYDYLQAYLAFYREDSAAAAVIAAQYKDYPVDTWRERFAAVAAQASEIAGANAPATDQQPGQDALAAQEPQLDLEVKEDALLIHYANLKSCELSFYPIDLEMLFTRSPFALADTSVVAGVKPMATLTVTFGDAKNQLEVPLPAEFATRHVIVKAEAGGIHRSGIRYASSLVAQLIERYGQIQITGKVDGKPLPKVYVKVFAQMQSGERIFYRDGYTDLRGRFDYASSSTLDIAQVQQFAILVISDEAGARVLTAAPPAR